jgi:hypothetical protein
MTRQSINGVFSVLFCTVVFNRQILCDQKKWPLNKTLGSFLMCGHEGEKVNKLAISDYNLVAV